MYIVTLYTQDTVGDVYPCGRFGPFESHTEAKEFINEHKAEWEQDSEGYDGTEISLLLPPRKAKGYFKKYTH